MRVQIEEELVGDPRQESLIDVSASGARLTVQPGTVHARKIKHSIAESWEYDFVSAPHGRVINGYLVRTPGADEPLRLFVIETENGKSPYRFAGGPLEAVYHLFRIDAPADVSHGSVVVVVTHRRYVPPPPRPARVLPKES